MDLDFILNHLGEERERYHGAVSPPVFQSSIFAFPSVAAMREGFRDEFATYLYTRGNNPTVEVLRKKLAALENSEDCLVFSSGAAAMAAAVFACVSAGDHVVCIAKPYSWTRSLLRDLLSRFGVSVTFVDGAEPDEFEAAITSTTRLIVLESPNSITFEQQDLAGIAALAQARGIITICDSSYATPLLQQPIAHGIDLVVHSATKYLNGHSDVVAGVLCGSETLLRKVFAGPFMTFGAIPSPHDAWLLLRGLRTLSVRMERISASTMKVLAFLESHPRVRRVYAPHASDNTQAELTQRQLGAASGMLTIDVDAPDVAAVERFCDSLTRFLMTVSWGGYESLALPVCAVFPPSSPLRPTTGLPLSLVRLSIGLEDPSILIDDLDNALTAMSR